MGHPRESKSSREVKSTNQDSYWNCYSWSAEKVVAVLKTHALRLLNSHHLRTVTLIDASRKTLAYIGQIQACPLTVNLLWSSKHRTDLATLVGIVVLFSLNFKVSSNVQGKEPRGDQNSEVHSQEKQPSSDFLTGLTRNMSIFPYNWTWIRARLKFTMRQKIIGVYFLDSVLLLKQLLCV